MTGRWSRRARNQPGAGSRSRLGPAAEALELLTCLALAAGVLVPAFLAPRRPAQAAAITVPCNVNDLVAAINAANDEVANPGPDTLTLASGCDYVLTVPDNADNGLPRITSAVVVDGDGSAISRDPAQAPFRLFTVDVGGNLTLNEVELTGGSAPGGALAVAGTVSLVGAMLSGNTANGGEGGAIAISGTGTATVADTTLSGNSGGTGGAIVNRGTLTVANSTVTGNSGTEALSSPGTLDVANSTVADNQGAALVTSGPASVTNTLLARNPGGCVTQAAGTLTDGGHNLSFGSPDCPGIDADPLLQPLADNGGPTLTMALGPNSPALDQVPATGAGCAPADQRGTARPRGAGCDIGSFEGNPPPAIMDNAYSTAEDTPLTPSAPGLLDNDSEPEGEALTPVLDAGPAHGTVALDPAGSFVYTPTPDFNGADSFTYRVQDPFGNRSGPATVSLAVTPANDIPVAAADAASTSEDSPVTLTVTANDTDADGDPLTAVPAAQPLHGDVACSAGSCVYTPDPDFFGSDAFDYSVSDGHGGAASATVQVTVAPVNDAPVAVDDDESTPEDTPVSVTVTRNDSDVDGDEVTVDDTTAPSHGVVVCSGDTCLYTPGLNFDGTDTFAYTVSDGAGGTDVGTVRITISAENDAPDATDDTYGTLEDQGATVTGPGVLANDGDVDGDAGLQAKLVSGPAHGRLDLRPDGSFSYVPDGDFSGTDSFTYQANDGLADSEPATVVLDVGAVNDVPVAAGDTATNFEGVPVVIPVVANDADADGDVLTVTDVTQPANGTASCAVRMCTYVSRVPLSGSDTFTYAVEDGKGGRTTGTVRVTVLPVRGTGYWLLGADGRVYAFGRAVHHGDAFDRLGGARAADLEATGSLNGYWICDDRGRVHAFGDATPIGSLAAGVLIPGEAVVALMPTATGKGYWLVSNRGRVFPLGDARPLGDLAGVRLRAPVVAGAATPSGGGYYLTAADGGVFAFGDATFRGSLANRRLAAAVVGIAADRDGRGYWLAAADGGVFAFEAVFLGTTQPLILNQPGSRGVAYGLGYLLVAGDGGVFVFSDRLFFGSLGARPPRGPIVATEIR